MQCLENIIGLTQNDCGCYDGLQPDGFDELNASTSGLYITDEVDGFPLLDAVFASIDCGRSDNVFSALAEDRRLAIQSFAIDVQGYLSSGRTNSGGFTGQVGREKHKEARSPMSSTYAGIVIRPRVARGRSFVLRSIKLGLGDASTTNVTVTSDNPNFTETTVSITNLAGKYGEFVFETPLALDFSEEYTYLIHYDSLGVRPINNVFSCCGERLKYPAFFTAGGFTGSDLLEDLETCCKLSWCNEPYGLVIDGFIACEDTAWLCNPETYGKNITQIISRTIQWKAAANTIQRVIDSGEINAYTTLNLEGLYGKRSSKLKAYTTNLEYIAQQAPKGSCLGCRTPIIDLKRGSLN